MEINLKENVWKFRNFFEKSPVGIVINDKPGNVIINERFCEMLGYSKEEFTKYKIIDEINHPEDRDLILDGVKKILKGKIKSFTIQKRYIKKNGSIMWANATLSILKDEKRGILTHFVMVEDIHDQKIMNDSLSFINQLGTSTDSMVIFNKIAKQISQTFEVPYVLVAEVEKGNLSCSSLSFWKNGGFAEFNYDLKNSPCLDAINHKALFCIEEKVQKKYPKFDALKKLNAECYIAYPLLILTIRSLV